jgi:tetratricopeptide (TPR) repeat protein
VIVLGGCAAKIPRPGPVKNIPPPQNLKKFQCDREADLALERGDIETGLHKHLRFVAEHPGNPLAHYHLGYAFGQLRNIEQEIAHYETAISLGYTQNDQLYFNLAMAQAELAQYHRAVASFKKALKIDPNAMDTLLELSGVYRQIGDIENERRILERCLKLKPDSETSKIIKKRLESLP